MSGLLGARRFSFAALYAHGYYNLVSKTDPTSTETTSGLRRSESVLVISMDSMPAEQNIDHF